MNIILKKKKKKEEIFVVLYEFKQITLAGGVSISALAIGKLFLDPHNHIYNYSGPLNNVGVMEADPHPLKTPQYNFQLPRHLLVAQCLQGGGSRMHPLLPTGTGTRGHCSPHVRWCSNSACSWHLGPKDSQPQKEKPGLDPWLVESRDARPWDLTGRLSTC